LIVDHVALIGEREVRGDEPGGATEFAVTFGDVHKAAPWFSPDTALGAMRPKPTAVN